MWSNGVMGSYANSHLFFFSSRRRHTRCYRDWSSDVCSSDLRAGASSPAPDTRDEQIELGVWAKRHLLGPADPFDEAYERPRIERAVDRAYHPAGFARQLDRKSVV